MGRKRKYFSDKEKREAQRRWQMEHYKRNADKIKAKARERYREKKRKEFYDKKVQTLYSELDI
jgi:hypothetical protein|tara:strand:+ start:899 stop:1087 length:189 start_codon:yes stop_codon:yes gene_type:complete